MAVLFLRKVLIGLPLPADGTGKVVTTVTDTLYLSHLAQHGTYLQLTFRTQASFRHLIQVVGYFQFHAVTDILIFLDAAEQFVEVIVLLRVQQVLHHSEHAVCTFGKQMDFLSRFQNRKFGSRKQPSGDEAQTIFLVRIFQRQQHADNPLDGLHKPDEQQHIEHIERRMESRQFKSHTGSRVCLVHHIRHKPRNATGEGVENDEHHNDTKHIEQQMGQCCPPRLRITGQCRQIGGNRRTDVLPHGKCRTQLKANPSVSTHDKGNGHGGCRSLYNHCDDRPHQHKYQYRKKTKVSPLLHKSQHLRILAQIRRIDLQVGKSHKKE